MPKKLRDPVFVFDSAETYLPLAVESVEAAPATLVTVDGRPSGTVSLDALPREGGRMNFPNDPEDQERRLRGEYGRVGYAGETPVCMTTSRHHSGGSRMWWEIQLSGERPTIYVALDSHANYFTPRQALLESEDSCDGRGERLDEIEWRQFGDWQDWPGLWGNSMGEGRSPQSPGRQGVRWKQPAIYHSH